MQAIVLEGHGPPGVLALREFPDPTPAPGQVLVELRAAAVNRRDALIRAGAGPAYQLPLPFVLGSDGAGIRRDTGEDVVILPSLSWGPSEEVAGPDFEILGGPSDGTYAELVAVPAENLYPKPAGFTWAQAAALPLASLTAYRALFSVGGLQRGERVVILGTGGGVSVAAIQLARSAGARVATTSSDEAKLRWASEHGADCTVDYHNATWVEELLEQFGAADLVLDSVGRTWPESVRLLRAGGRLVACGGTGGAEVTLDVRALYLQQKRILGTKMGSPADFRALLALVRSERLAPLIDSERPLSEAAAAHERIEAASHFGKLILDVRG